MKKCFPFLLSIFFFFGCGDSSTPDTVIDNSGLLSSEEITALQEYNAALLKDHDIDFRMILEKDKFNAAALNSRANALITGKKHTNDKLVKSKFLDG